MWNLSAMVMEGFLLQARNIHLFIPIFLIAVAYSTISVLGYSNMVQPLLTKVFHDAEDLWGANPVWTGYADLVVETCIRAGHLVAASTAYLLITTFTTGPAVLAYAVFAAVAACSGERSRRLSSSSHALVRMLLAGGDGLKGPFRTALLGNILHAVACRGTILVLGFYVGFFLRYTNHVLLSTEFFLLLLGHLFALYMEVVCTLAVVVSAAEPAGCFYGVRALRQAWWIMAEKTTPAVILVFVKGALKAVMTVSIRVGYVYPIHYYYTLAYVILSGFMYISLCAALEMWFVCATTIYYYQCRQHKDSYHCSI